MHREGAGARLTSYPQIQLELTFLQQGDVATSERRQTDLIRRLYLSR